MFCNDQEVVSVMRKIDTQRILCAGTGSSVEPRALAAAGFEVVAVDLSPRALEIAKTFPSSKEQLQHYIDPRSVRSGGSVEFVVGDLFDASVASGPFDTIIERRTAQTYEAEDRATLLSSVAARMTPEGIFVSHCHDNRWKPGTKPRHATGEWFRNYDWVIWNGGPGTKPPGRVAWLVTTTG
jgi:2-polyprenyl-3-methyl-5-hydroxy-6-metoxy-1,4-benzoquinol methylase